MFFHYFIYFFHSPQRAREKTTCSREMEAKWSTEPSEIVSLMDFNSDSFAHFSFLGKKNHRRIPFCQKVWFRTERKKKRMRKGKKKKLNSPSKFCFCDFHIRFVHFLSIFICSMSYSLLHVDLSSCMWKILHSKWNTFEFSSSVCLYVRALYFVVCAMKSPSMIQWDLNVHANKSTNEFRSCSKCEKKIYPKALCKMSFLLAEKKCEIHENLFCSHFDNLINCFFVVL